MVLLAVLRRVAVRVTVHTCPITLTDVYNTSPVFLNTGVITSLEHYVMISVV